MTTKPSGPMASSVLPRTCQRRSRSSSVSAARSSSPMVLLVLTKYPGNPQADRDRRRGPFPWGPALGAAQGAWVASHSQGSMVRRSVAPRAWAAPPRRSRSDRRVRASFCGLERRRGRRLRRQRERRARRLRCRPCGSALPQMEASGRGLGWGRRSVEQRSQAVRPDFRGSMGWPMPVLLRCFEAVVGTAPRRRAVRSRPAPEAWAVS